VLIGDIHEQRGAETVAALMGRGAEVDFLRCDVRDDGALEAAALWMDERWGGVDIVLMSQGSEHFPGVGAFHISFSTRSQGSEHFTFHFPPATHHALRPLPVMELDIRSP